MTCLHGDVSPQDALVRWHAFDEYFGSAFETHGVVGVWCRMLSSSKWTISGRGRLSQRQACTTWRIHFQVTSNKAACSQPGQYPVLSITALAKASANAKHSGKLHFTRGKKPNVTSRDFLEHFEDQIERMDHAGTLCHVIIQNHALIAVLPRKFVRRSLFLQASVVSASYQLDVCKRDIR